MLRALPRQRQHCGPDVPAHSRGADALTLLRTWHSDTRPETLELDPDQKWYLLEILGTERGGPFEREGVVTFRAHYRSAANRKLRDSFTETSSFTKVGSQWLYVQALELQ